MTIGEFFILAALIFVAPHYSKGAGFTTAAFFVIAAIVSTFFGAPK